MGITAGSREVPGRNACDKRHPYRIIIILIISFMRGIYTYIPETNYVPREYSVAAIIIIVVVVVVVIKCLDCTSRLQVVWPV